jgi:hypothetical protein
LLGYGKSDILSRVERGVKYCTMYHAKKFVTMATKRDIAQAEQINGKNTNEMSDEEQQQSSITEPNYRAPKMIFNDGTRAGILHQLDSCTRALCLHEADTTMGSWNVMQSGPLDRTSGRIDPFRSTIMTLYDDPGSFTLLLKNEQINTEGSKLVLLVSDVHLIFLTYPLKKEDFYVLLKFL